MLCGYDTAVRIVPSLIAVICGLDTAVRIVTAVTAVLCE